MINKIWINLLCLLLFVSLLSISGCKKEDEEACFLFGLDGPLWYNGYFADDMTSAKVENILNYMEAEKMVIGHSKVESVQYLFNKQIIAIDTHADSKDDLTGVISESYSEGLLIEDDIYYKINNLGDKSELK